jgi:molybdopterin molybdotransferase
MMITEKEAWQLILKHAEPMPAEKCLLENAVGCFTAEAVRADRDIPPSDRSAMDGYAVYAADLQNTPAVLKIAGEVAAGSPDKPEFASGQCIRIFTGAAIPPQADTVVMQEDTESAGDNAVRFMKSIPAGQNIFRRGENAHNGDVLVPAGVTLNAVRIGLCASAGNTSVAVRKKCSVAILATGDEIKSAGEEVADHQTRDSNGPMLQALLTANRFPCTAPRSVADRPGVLLDALQSALDSRDIVLLSGGVSVGDYDLVPDTIKKAGGNIIYHGILVKPGKPQLMAAMPNGKYVFGLPGNPLSVMTGMQEFVLPFLRMRAGCNPQQARILRRLPLAEDARSGGKRQQYVLARYTEKEGQTALQPIAGSGSADLAASGSADGAIIIPAGTKLLPAGTVADFRPWEYPA